MSDSEYSSDIEEQEDVSPVIADFISENKNELEQLLQLTNKMNMLNDQLKSIKKERKEIYYIYYVNDEKQQHHQRKTKNYCFVIS